MAGSQDFEDLLTDIKLNVLATYAFASTFDEAMEEATGKRIPLENRMRTTVPIDLASFMIYLSASDGYISYDEVNTINTFLDLSLTKADCDRLYRDTGIGTGEFKRKLPTSFVALRAAHMIATGKDLGAALFNLYAALGSLVIAMDGNVDPGEKRALDDYMRMLADHVNSYSAPSSPSSRSNYSSYSSSSSSSSGGGCYVATAVYGSYNCPQVWTLRRYRDYHLAASRHGRAFIRGYYAVSPTLVKWFGKSNWFKSLCRPRLDRLVAKCRGCGYEDTPYDDRIW